ncbi:MAG: hypothetical protein HS115_11610 [Spirochaetales bacterium]|nr:hypothetical protein [Spirochaetales bacterium]
MSQSWPDQSELRPINLALSAIAAHCAEVGSGLSPAEKRKLSSAALAGLWVGLKRRGLEPDQFMVHRYRLDLEKLYNAKVKLEI